MKKFVCVVALLIGFAGTSEADGNNLHRNELHLWAGNYSPLWIDNNNANGNFYGGKINFFFPAKVSSLNRFHLGVGAVANGWDDDGENEYYPDSNGYRITAGPVIEMTGKEFRFTSSLQYGRQNNQYRMREPYKGWKEHEEQEINIIYFGLTFDSYIDVNGSAKKFESWLDANFDVGNKKGYRIANSFGPMTTSNNGSINFGSRYYFWFFNGFKTGIVAKAGYSCGDARSTSIVGFVVSSLMDTFKLGVEFKNASNPQYPNPDGTSVGITLDLELKR